jgi:hypothetical protein
MLQFDAAPVVTSILFCVSGKEFLSRNREVLGDMRDRGREASPMRRRSRRGTLHLPNWEAPRGRAGRPIVLLSVGILIKPACSSGGGS